jgi:hypothetical protein
MLDEIPQMWQDMTASGGVLSAACLPDQSRRWRAFMAKDHVAPEGDDSQLLQTEIWRPVPSEPGIHASSWGRVLQAPVYAPLPKGGYRLYTPAPRYGQVSRSHKNAAHEYRHIMVRRHGHGPRQQPRKVHQLVCEAFHGPKPFDGAVVIHLDENALNNRPENLRWGTQKENLNAPGYISKITGRKLPRKTATT